MKKNSEGETKYKWIILLDELQIWNNLIDFSSLNVRCEDISIIAAVNPIAVQTPKFDFIPPKDELTMFERLTFKHRSCTEISVFLHHFMMYYSKESTRKSIDNSANAPLVHSTFPSGRLPILVKLDKDTNEEEYLNALEKHVLIKDTDVVLVCKSTLMAKPGKFGFISNYCKERQWKLMPDDEIIGSEANVVIAYRCNGLSFPEIISRAKKQLILIEK